MVQFFEENMTVARVFKFCICIYAMHNLVVFIKPLLRMHQPLETYQVLG